MSSGFIHRACLLRVAEAWRPARAQRRGAHMSRCQFQTHPEASAATRAAQNLRVATFQIPRPVSARPGVGFTPDGGTGAALLRSQRHETTSQRSPHPDYIESICYRRWQNYSHVKVDGYEGIRDLRRSQMLFTAMFPDVKLCVCVCVRPLIWIHANI